MNFIPMTMQQSFKKQDIYWTKKAWRTKLCLLFAFSSETHEPIQAVLIINFAFHTFFCDTA